MDSDLSTKANTEQLSSPEAKASRLKRLRNLANLTREEFCNTDDLNAFTLKGWELARRGGVTTAGAQRVIERVAKEGVICSVDWLLTGAPPEPYLIPQTSTFRSTTADTSQKILREISVFQSHESDIIYTEVTDDALEPFCEAGDYVAGRKLPLECISDAFGKYCIVITSSGSVYTRLLKEGAEMARFNLLPINLESKTKESFINNVSAIAVAPILRLYKTS